MIVTERAQPERAATQSAPAAAHPQCVAHLLAALESVSAALADGRTSGPYALDALLDDVALCPAIDAKPGLTGDIRAAVVDAIDQARNAARVMRSCPGSDGGWVAARLGKAVAQSRLQLAARVADADATGDDKSLSSARCSECIFAAR